MFELNEDWYKCYMKAEHDPKIRYIWTEWRIYGTKYIWNRNMVSNDSTEENLNVISEHLAINNKLIVSDTEIQAVEGPVSEVNQWNIKDTLMQNIAIN